MPAKSYGEWLTSFSRGDKSLLKGLRPFPWLLSVHGEPWTIAGNNWATLMVRGVWCDCPMAPAGLRATQTFLNLLVEWREARILESRVPLDAWRKHLGSPPAKKGLGHVESWLGKRDELRYVHVPAVGDWEPVGMNIRLLQRALSGAPLREHVRVLRVNPGLGVFKSFRAGQEDNPGAILAVQGGGWLISFATARPDESDFLDLSLFPPSGVAGALQVAGIIGAVGLAGALASKVAGATRGTT